MATCQPLIASVQRMWSAFASQTRGSGTPDDPLQIGSEKKHIKKKPNKIFTRLARDFWGDFIYVFFSRRRTNVQQLTCKIDSSNSFYYLFFSFVLLELKPFVLKGKVLGDKLCKSVKKCEKL